MDWLAWSWGKGKALALALAAKGKGKGKKDVKGTPPAVVETPPEKPIRKQRKCDDPRFQLPPKDVPEKPEGKRAKAAKATREMVEDTNHKTVEKRKKRKTAEEDQHDKEEHEDEEKEDEHAEEEQHVEEDDQQDEEHEKPAEEEDKEEEDGGERKSKKKARFLTLRFFSLKYCLAWLSFDIDVSNLSSKQKMKAFNTILLFWTIIGIKEWMKIRISK